MITNRQLIFLQNLKEYYIETIILIFKETVHRKEITRKDNFDSGTAGKKEIQTRIKTGVSLPSTQTQAQAQEKKVDTGKFPG